MLAAISGPAGNTEIAISVVTLVELAHGEARADTPARRAKRQQFIQELLTALPIHPITVPVALRANALRQERAKPLLDDIRSEIEAGVTVTERCDLRHCRMVHADEILLVH